MKWQLFFVLLIGGLRLTGQNPAADFEWQQIIDFEGRDILFLFDNGERLYAGVAGLGPMFSEDEGATWQKVQVDSSAIYPTSLRKHQGVYYLTSLNGAIYESRDGQSFRNVSTDLPAFAIWASTVEQNKLYVAGSDGIYVSDDPSGEGWRQDLPEELYQGEILFEIEAKAGLVVAGGRRRIYLKDQQSKRWTAAPFDFKFDIRNIHIFNNQTIWVGTNGDGAYMSSDQGESWTQIDRGRLRRNVIFISKTEPEELVTISSEGLYKDDVELNVGTIVHSFKNIVRHKDYFYSGTTSKGIWKFQSPAPQAGQLPAHQPANDHLVTLNIFPNPTNGRFSVLLRQNFVLPESDGFQLLFFDVSGKIIKRMTISAATQFWQEELALEIAPGIYRYDLIRNDELVQTGQLIISK